MLAVLMQKRLCAASRQARASWWHQPPLARSPAFVGAPSTPCSRCASLSTSAARQLQLQLHLHLHLHLHLLSSNQRISSINSVDSNLHQSRHQLTSFGTSPLQRRSFTQLQLSSTSSNNSNSNNSNSNNSNSSNNSNNISSNNNNSNNNNASSANKTNNSPSNRSYNNPQRRYKSDSASSDWTVPSRIDIPTSSLDFSYVRSSGAGGQNVNKVNSQVQVDMHVQSASWLPLEVRQRILEREATRINSRGYLQLYSQESRSQSANKEAVIKKLQNIILQAWPRPKERNMRVGISDKTKQERIDYKRQRQKTKDSRRPIRYDD
jgi:protein subunit release factor B